MSFSLFNIKYSPPNFLYTFISLPSYLSQENLLTSLHNTIMAIITTVPSDVLFKIFVFIASDTTECCRILCTSTDTSEVYHNILFLSRLLVKKCYENITFFKHYIDSHINTLFIIEWDLDSTWIRSTLHPMVNSVWVGMIFNISYVHIT